MKRRVHWARDWAVIHGTTAEEAAVVLAAYFSGLALGSYLGGRLALARGLVRYAAPEAGPPILPLRAPRVLDPRRWQQ